MTLRTDGRAVGRTDEGITISPLFFEKRGDNNCITKIMVPFTSVAKIYDKNNRTSSCEVKYFRSLKFLKLE